MPSVAMLTTAPNAALKQVGRDAMPAILPPDRGAWATWLRGGWDKSSRLLQPYSSSLMQMVER